MKHVGPSQIPLRCALSSLGSICTCDPISRHDTRTQGEPRWAKDWACSPSWSTWWGASLPVMTCSFRSILPLFDFDEWRRSQYTIGGFRYLIVARGQSAIIASLEIEVLVASSQHFFWGGGSSWKFFPQLLWERQLSLFDCFLNRVNMGFHLDSQAIEAALGCVQCSTILCTGKVVQSSLVHQCLDIFEGSLGCCQLEYMLLPRKVHEHRCQGRLGA